MSTSSSTTSMVRRRSFGTTAATGTTRSSSSAWAPDRTGPRSATRVKVTAGGHSQIDEVTSGSSYYSQNDFRLHFGLGADQGRSRGDRVALGSEGDVFRTSRRITSSARNRRASSAAAGFRSADHAGGSRTARIALFASCSPCVVAAAAVQFTDVTQPARIEFEHRNSGDAEQVPRRDDGRRRRLLDYDNDGRLDVFFTNGARLDDPMADGTLPDKTDPTFWNRLYRQTQEGRSST